MTIQLIGVPPCETVLCRYGASRLLVRGPKRALDQPYVAFLGGAETFAKETARPFPAVLERQLGVTCVNLAAICAGPDAYTGDPALLAVAAAARVKVVQLSGAHMLSNRFYSVHPRRNDRFVKASAQMRQQFAGVDFTDFAFVGHMVGQLAQDNPAGFALLRAELETAWQARMRRLLEVLGPPIVLLWVERPRPDGARPSEGWNDPLFITPQLLAPVLRHAAGLVRISPDQPQGGAQLDQHAHHQIAEALLPNLQPHLPAAGM